MKNKFRNANCVQKFKRYLQPFRIKDMSEKFCEVIGIFYEVVLQKCCNEWKKGVKEWGEPIVNKIFQRLMKLRAVNNLSKIIHLPPPRCQMDDYHSKQK